MRICPICGGVIAPEEPNCPYCGKTQFHPDGATSGNPSEWDLMAEDNTSLSPSPPTAWVTPAPPPGPAAAGGGDDWLLPEAMLEGPSPQPVPAPAPEQPLWTPSPPPAQVSLPPWAPISPAEPASRGGTTFDFEFDLEGPGAGPAPAQPPAPSPFEPQTWGQPPANMNLQAPVVSPVPVTPIPVTPIPVTPIPITPVSPPPPAYAAPPPAAYTPPVQQPPVYAAPPAAAPAPPPVVYAPTPAGRTCPSCGRTYGPDYRDSFCDCGAELVEAAPPPAPPPQAAAKPTAVPQRPPAGTRCLVLYGPDKQPVHYFALSKDAMLVGRLDAASGCFPDIDVSEHVDEAMARKVSRKHALILRSRSSDSFTLRALPGNTGTQVDARLLSGPEEVPLPPGTRVILGGAVRFKFEVM
jgi:hypothetical protein